MNNFYLKSIIHIGSDKCISEFEQLSMGYSGRDITDLRI